LCAADEAASGTGAAEVGVFAAVVRSAAAANADLSLAAALIAILAAAALIAVAAPFTERRL